MPSFRLPYSNITVNEPDAIQKLADNLEALVRNYNDILQDLDAEVFYHVIPIVTGEAVETGATTPTHKIKVRISGTDYLIPLEPV